MADEILGQDPQAPDNGTGNQNEPSQSNPTQDPNGGQDPVQQDPQEPASPRYQRRVSSLVNKVKESTDTNQQLEQELNGYRRQGRPEPSQNPDHFKQDLESEYKRGQQETQSQVAAEFFKRDLDTDQQWLESRYPELDERSDNFDPDLEADIAELYARAVGYNEKTGTISNPNVRLREIASMYLDRVTSRIDSQAGETARNVATQASRTGVRPGSPSRKTSLGELKPGDVSKMDGKTYEKNKEAINKAILDQLGV